MNLVKSSDWRFCVAPLMDGTDRHCRYFHRLLSGRARLYSEMMVAEAAVRGDPDRLLGFDPSEHPVALQLGGADPALLARAARIGADLGYDEINLNVGCPSDRVQSGTFGACLMKTPMLVADCVAAMRAAVDIPVTVKCRIGVDDHEGFEFLDHFISTVAAAGCRTFILHARKAWLKGLSPKENREVPPLDYNLVRQIKLNHSNLNIILNGGLTTTEQIYPLIRHPAGFDGVMIGREAYQNPYFLADIEREIFKNPSVRDRETVALDMIYYIKKQMELYDIPIKSITRHMMGLFHAQPGGRVWRQALSTLPFEPGAKPDIIMQALEARQRHLPLAA